MDADSGRQDKKWMKNPPNSKNSRIFNSKGSLTQKDHYRVFLKSKYENVINRAQAYFKVRGKNLLTFFWEVSIHF
jgi:hypothetical protein